MAIDQLRGKDFGAVVCDLDQTLVDSAGALGRVWQTWLAEFGVVPDASRTYHGWTSEAIIRLCLPEDRVAEGVERMHQLETTVLDGVTALPGAPGVFAAVPAHQLAVATSGEPAVARARLAAAGLPEPRVLVTAADVAHGKPAPDIFLAAADRLGVEPGDCLVLEDSVAGVEAARAAGMAVLAVLTSTPAEQLPTDNTVATLAEVSWQVSGGRITVG